jgi:hypothetical protein
MFRFSLHVLLSRLYNSCIGTYLLLCRWIGLLLRESTGLPVSVTMYWSYSTSPIGFDPLLASGSLHASDSKHSSPLPISGLSNNLLLHNTRRIMF